MSKKQLTPKLVHRLRFMVKQYPEAAEKLKQLANQIMFTNLSLGVPPERFENTGAYKHGEMLFKQLTHKPWPGENRAD